MGDLKKITIEEWDKIPKSIIDKCGKSYVKRLKKVIELNGERLEPFHLKEIEKELPFINFFIIIIKVFIFN